MSHGLTTLALHGPDSEGLDSAIQAHAEHPLHTSGRNLFGLYMAKNDTSSTRAVLDVALEEDPGSVFWQVQELYLDLLRQNNAPATATHLISPLQELAATGGYGGGHARAWLAMLGAGQPEVIILPTPTKRLRQPEEILAQRPTMQVFPNPSQGIVNVAVQVPEGAEQATLRVLDPLGRVMHQRRLAAGTLQEELHLALPAGSYVAVVYLNESHAVNTWFQVIP